MLRNESKNQNCIKWSNPLIENKKQELKKNKSKKKVNITKEVSITSKNSHKYMQPQKIFSKKL